MKTHLVSLAFVLATVGTASVQPVASAPRPDSPMAYTVRTVIQNRQPVLERGDLPITALRELGRPHQKLADDVWVYFGFRAGIDQADKRGCDTLIITFARGHVSDIKLVNNSAQAVIAARLKDNPVGQDGLYVVRE